MTSKQPHTMNARDLYREGKIEEAIEAMNAEVRSHPADVDRRGFLCDLLCLVGNFDRADVQLEAISKQLPGAAVGVSLIRQLVRAEQWRQQCFVEGRSPKFLEKPGDRLQLHLRATVQLREGDVAGAAELLAQAEELREPLSGTHDGEPFDDFRDCDDVCASFFEVLTSTGKYYWIPMERVVRLEPRPLEHPRDLLWRRVGMQVEGGPDGEVYLPAIYAPAPAELPARTGRTTEWSEEEPIRGKGLRTFLVGEETASLLEIGELGFGPQSA